MMIRVEYSLLLLKQKPKGIKHKNHQNEKNWTSNVQEKTMKKMLCSEKRRKTDMNKKIK